jgi:hypothetical protein
VAVSVPLTGLSANHIYRVRIVATNRVGTSYGEEQQFVTPR